jgi:uncharacterized protein (DUF1778 family)
MNAPVDISAEAVRQHLLDRAKAFSERTKTSFSAISQAAVADSKFLANVSRGSNFTVNTYQRVINWLDEQEATQSAGEAA